MTESWDPGDANKLRRWCGHQQRGCENAGILSDAALFRLAGQTKTGQACQESRPRRGRQGILRITAKHALPTTHNENWRRTALLKSPPSRSVVPSPSFPPQLPTMPKARAANSMYIGARRSKPRCSNIC